MYNTEKYIGACLTSILNQTFQDFEVIVVDDCSTDNSCAIVESFIPKFGGRLKLYRSEVNSGPAIPSNKGVSLSRGKYLFIMDSDDLIVDNTLEILIKYAENYDADVVHMDLGFKFRRNSDKPFPDSDDVDVVGWHGGPFVIKPTLESDNLAERMTKISRNGVGWTAWEKFVRRDLIMENEIIFPDMRTSQDIIWVIEVFSCAKKILTIPETLYFHRANPTSNTGIKRTAAESLHFFMDNSVFGMNFLLNFFNRKKFFRENPKFRWKLLNFWEVIHLNTVRKFVETMPPHEIYEILQSTFTEKFGEYGNLLAYFCQSSNLLRYQFQATAQRAAQLENELAKIHNDKFV